MFITKKIKRKIKIALKIPKQQTIPSLTNETTTSMN